MKVTVLGRRFASGRLTEGTGRTPLEKKKLESDFAGLSCSFRRYNCVRTRYMLHTSTKTFKIGAWYSSKHDSSHCFVYATLLLHDGTSSAPNMTLRFPEM